MNNFIEKGEVMRKVYLGIASIIVIITTGFIYTLLHEGGHALAALVFGAKISAFEVNFFRVSPHISYVGELSNIQKGIVSLAGPLFPLLISFVIISFLPKLKRPLLQVVVLSFSFSTLTSLLPNIIFPLLYMGGKVGYNEDVIHFIQHVDGNPLMVCLGFFTLFCIGLLYLFKVGKVVTIFKAQRKLSLENWANFNKPLVLILGIVLIMLATGILFPGDTHDAFTGYNYGVEYEADEEGEGFISLVAFGLSEAKKLNMRYETDTLSTVCLELINTDGEPFLFINQDRITIHSGGAMNNGIFSGFYLDAGAYEIRFSSFKKGDKIKLSYNFSELDPVDNTYADYFRMLNSGTFTQDTYEEESYELVYYGEEVGTGITKLYEVAEAPGYLEISAFAQGQWDNLSLWYEDDLGKQSILVDHGGTVGRGIEVGSGKGSINLELQGGKAEIFLYLKK